MNSFDIDGWLLRTTEQPWSSNHISNILDNSILDKVIEKWNILEIATKLKLFFCFFALKPENKLKLKDQISKIIEMGKNDEGKKKKKTSLFKKKKEKNLKIIITFLKKKRKEKIILFFNFFFFIFLFAL